MMVREGMGFVVLLGEFSEVAVDVVGVATFSFQLNGHVFDAEVCSCSISDHLVSADDYGSDREILVAKAR
jgi:hypothetical protein